jgi:16S rRNA (guanine527-N7)-methyltransferase
VNSEPMPSPRPPKFDASDAALLKALAADRERALALMDVSRETLARLDRFVALLLDAQTRHNLVAPSTLSRIWTRHVADSAQLLALAPNASTWADLGSGAGFPGVVIACALTDTPGATVHLVESIGKKAAFLTEVVRSIDLPAKVHCLRIEKFVTMQIGPLDVVTARALAPLDKLLGLAEPLLSRGAQALLLKGQDVEAELTAASKCWNIEATLVPSKTSPEGRIVVVTGLQRLDNKR